MEKPSCRLLLKGCLPPLQQAQHATQRPHGDGELPRLCKAVAEQAQDPRAGSCKARRACCFRQWSRLRSAQEREGELLQL